MDHHDIARVLGEIAALLELQGENPFRVRAYRTAARTLSAYGGDLREARAAGALPELRGLGPATLEMVEELLDTGTCRMLEDLRDQVPPGLVDMLRIAGLGVAKVRQIHNSLQVDSLGELEVAARDGRLASLPRFGWKTAEKILKGIQFLRQADGALLVHHARAAAAELVGVLEALPEVVAVHRAGSLRRGTELVRDLDLVVVARDAPASLAERLREGRVAEFTQASETAITLRLTGGTVVDLFPCTPDRLGFVLLRATGSEPHLQQLAARAAARGLRWTAEGLVRSDRPLAAPTEDAVYAALGLPWIPPELREGRGEVDAAAAGRLPCLVERRDLRGFLHCHSAYSDGADTIAVWADAARAEGYDYLGLTDHSPATAFTGGLAAEAIPRQHAEIDAANARGSGARVLKGVEADILEDGTLDYAPAVRRQFEFVIASVHTRFGMDAEQLTARVLRAMDDPSMTVLGHPTGRLLLSRDPFPLDLDRVFACAADRGIAIEINADPQRLDLDWRVLRQAVTAGVTIAIGADAHGVANMDHVDLGVAIARKGWLTADHILNTRSADEFLAFARRRR
ncbi:MAG: DNA polymerase/3'-5' exonuclease PolX [Gemmatimonadota bacterium]|nr:DNA polymerase/3'-5' exonuclease PolX [Gemmatimonadota bacterium]